MHNHGKSWNRGDQKEVKKAYENGMTCGALAGRYGRSTPAMWSRLQLLRFADWYNEDGKADDTISTSKPIKKS